MLLVQGRILQKYGFQMCLLAVLGSQGIVVKCTAAIFFLTVDWKGEEEESTMEKLSREHSWQQVSENAKCEFLSPRVEKWNCYYWS